MFTTAWIRVILIIGSAALCAAQPPTTLEMIGEIMEQVNIDSMLETVSHMSGETAFQMNGASHTLTSRHYQHPGNDLACQYLAARLSAYGLDTHIQTYSDSGKNVYALQPGNSGSEDRILIGAHYDSWPPGDNAPGADDNASGCAAVLEAARILSQYDFPGTIMYALFDEEEPGAFGSTAMATGFVNDGTPIIGLINLDMIAFDDDDDGVFLVNVFSVGNTLAMYAELMSVYDQFDFGVVPVQVFPGFGSDNVFFWQQGIGALGIEENYFGDWNVNYHTHRDWMSFFNLPYMLGIAKLAIGTLASIAYDSQSLDFEKATEILPTTHLIAAFPNPFNPETNIHLNIAQPESVSLTVYDLSGHTVKTLIKERKISGDFHLTWDGTNDLGYEVEAGLYLCRLQVRDDFRTLKLIHLK